MISGPIPAGSPIVTAIFGRVSFFNRLFLFGPAPEDPFGPRVMPVLVLPDNPVRPLVEVHVPALFLKTYIDRGLFLEFGQDIGECLLAAPVQHFLSQRVFHGGNIR